MKDTTSKTVSSARESTTNVYEEEAKYERSSCEYNSEQPKNYSPAEMRLEKEFGSKVDKIVAFSDLCLGKNKNINVAAAFYYFTSLSDTVLSVEHKFFDPARIEKAKSAAKFQVRVPRGWYQLDLVKTHLMYAVREEVVVLKEKIAELMERTSQLEYENNILRTGVNQETLDQLNSSILLTGQAASNAAQPASNAAQPASNAAQPASNAAQPASNAAQQASNAAQQANNAAQQASNTAQPVSNSGKM
uniref:Uncharacterized protein n=1 Tax=Timema tahoe TaxID=61484 RepID=A0A7R9FK19_9NEOP|nr:unnamed protein product [Timema tahoe]